MSADGESTQAARPEVPLWTPLFVRATLAHLAVGVGGAFGIHLPGMLHDLGAREAEIGRIMAVTALTALVLGPLSGKLMDARGRPLALRLGGMVLCVSSAGYLVVSEIGPLVYALRVLEGVGAMLLYAALFTYAADIVPAARRTQGLALFGAAGLLSLGISSLAGDFLLAVAGYRALFASALVCFVAGTALAGTLPDSRSPVPSGTGVPSTWATARQRDLLPVWLGAFAFFLSMASVMTFTKTLAIAAGHGHVGGFFTAYSLTALALRVLLGALPDRVGPERMVLPALGSYAAGVLCAVHAGGAEGLLLAGVLCGAGHGYAFPVLLSLTVSRARPEARGAATAIFTTVDWAGHVAAPPLVGFAVERFGYGGAFGAMAAVLALGVAAFHLLDRRAK